MQKFVILLCLGNHDKEKYLFSTYAIEKKKHFQSLIGWIHGWGTCGSGRADCAVVVNYILPRRGLSKRLLSVYALNQNLLVLQTSLLLCPASYLAWPAPGLVNVCRLSIGRKVF